MEGSGVRLCDREGPLGRKWPACMSLFVLLFSFFLRGGGGFSVHYHFVNEKGIPDLSGPSMARTIGSYTVAFLTCGVSSNNICLVFLIFNEVFFFFTRYLLNAPPPHELFCSCSLCASTAALASVPFRFVLVRVPPITKHIRPLPYASTSQETV